MQQANEIYCKGQAFNIVAIDLALIVFVAKS